MVCKCKGIMGKPPNQYVQKLVFIIYCDRLTSLELLFHNKMCWFWIGSHCSGGVVNSVQVVW